MHMARLETVCVSVSVSTTKCYSGGGGYHHQFLIAGGWVSPSDVTSMGVGITEGVPYLSHGTCDIPTPP